MGKDTGSVLTPSQREFLHGDKDVTPDSSHGRMIQSRIRDRVEKGLFTDIPLLVKVGDPDDLLKNTDRGGLENALADLVAFAFQLSHAADLNFDAIVDEGRKLGRGNRAEVILSRIKNDDKRITIADMALLAADESIDEDAFKSIVADRMSSGNGPLTQLSNSEATGEWLAETLLDEYRDAEE